MPRPRFRLLSFLALPVVVGVGMTVWIMYAPAVQIDGDQDVKLEVEIRDAASGNPIGNALIQVSDPFGYLTGKQTSQGTTRSEGRARIVHRFRVVGERRAYRFKGKVYNPDRWLEVSAPGYQRLFAPLARFTGEQGDVRRTALIRVTLREGESPGDVLQDVAGSYECLFGQGFSTLVILADGRFSWRASGCWSQETEYGFVRLVDGALSLKPIPRKQHEVSTYVLATLYPIRWGACPFLLYEEQILDFCNAINQGPDPGKQVTRDFYHPVKYWGKKLEALPVLPGQWNTYLLKQPVSATIRQVADDGSATIDRGSQDGIKKGMHLKAHGMKGDQYPYREVEAVAVDVHFSVVRRVLPDCAWRQQLSYFGDGALRSGEKVTSRFREDDAEMLAGSDPPNR